MDLLPQVSFSIMLALSLRPRHGYEIMSQVDEDSLGKIKLGPGSLYTSIRILSEAGLIEEIVGSDPRRRYYQLTKNGRARLNAELEYFQQTVNIARERQMLNGLGQA